MAIEEHDPVSGHNTTGHEWNGIKELDTPVPRGILIFLIVTHVFAFVWWILMPAWPLGDTYTAGLLETDQYQEVEQELLQTQAARAPWVDRLESASFDEISSDPQLMSVVRGTGNRLFGDYCAACHGLDAEGGPDYPDLTDGEWQWGGSPEQIAQTLRVGVNTEYAQSRRAEMPGFGATGILDRAQIGNTAAFVYALSHPEYVTLETREAVALGRELFDTNCAVCHGQNGRGNQDLGAPNLTDPYWTYGGDLQQIITTIHIGRRGHMPTWDERFTEAEIKIMALYVHQLAGEGR